MYFVAGEKASVLVCIFFFNLTSLAFALSSDSAHSEMNGSTIQPQVDLSFIREKEKSGLSDGWSGPKERKQIDTALDCRT